MKNKKWLILRVREFMEKIEEFIADTFQAYIVLMLLDGVYKLYCEETIWLWENENGDNDAWNILYDISSHSFWRQIYEGQKRHAGCNSFLILDLKSINKCVARYWRQPFLREGLLTLVGFNQVLKLTLDWYNMVYIASSPAHIVRCTPKARTRCTPERVRLREASPRN